MPLGHPIKSHRLTTALLLALLAACATAPPPPPPPTPVSELKAQAEAARAAKQYSQAALIYQKLALRVSGEDRQQFLLNAAQAYLDGQRTGEAGKVLQSLVPQKLSDRKLDRYVLLQARLALLEQRYQDVPRLLQPVLRDDTPAADRAQIHLLRAQAYARLGHNIEAVRERVALEPLLTDPAFAEHNRTQVWALLGRLSTQALEILRTAPPPDPLSGWLEVALIARTTPDLSLGPALDAWRARYPGHSAAKSRFFAELEARQPPVLPQPGQIAVLLPMSGPYGKVASAVRDGFLAAYFARPNPDYQPLIRFYDTGAPGADIKALYKQALLEGAQYVVGPLNKDKVSALKAGGDIPVPTLALNYSEDDPGLPPKHFFQFGLAPEDEARQIAERAWLQGYSRALAFYPRGEWGERVYAAFAAHWQNLGGTVLKARNYPPRESDFSAPLRDLLGVSASEKRARQLRRVLGEKLEFQARRRKDVDFIFLTALPRQARLIRPQLKFFYAGDVPVLATSHVYAGSENPALDRDMDGVLFTDIPWLLSGDPVRTSVEAAWPDAGGLARLYALGADAYRLLPLLQQLRTQPLSEVAGATGRLSLDERQHLHRTLVWARFQDGRPAPAPLDTTPETP
ncbi:MAG TPA: penicillin-binding protein activator [Gammaproteobacteria bacterium]|nr:penicillin-binding protein activator [Gammaproteobacteria bacterium]